MPRRQQTQYRQIEAQQPYMGEYSALAEQFLRKKDKPIYSVGQGLVEAGSDIAEAFLMKKAAEREQRKEDKDISDVAMAQRFAMDPGLARDKNSGALYSAEDFGGLQTQGIEPMSAQQRAAAATGRLSDVNPRAALATAPGMLDLAQQFEAPKDTYEINKEFGVMRRPAGGGQPEVVMSVPTPARASQLLTPDEEAQKLRIEAAGRTPQAAMTPVEMYQKNFGPLAPGMMPEIVDGRITPRQVPQPSGPQDPAVIEQKRIEALKADLPSAQNKLMSVTQPLRSLAGQIRAAKTDPNTKDVTGPYEGRTSGGVLGRFSEGNSTAASRIENIRNVAQSIGLNLTRMGGIAPGSITQAEWPKFEAYVANLDPSQGDKAFTKQLDVAEKMATGLLQAMETEFKTTYAPVLPKVEATTRSETGPEYLESLLNKYAPP